MLFNTTTYAGFSIYDGRMFFGSFTLLALATFFEPNNVHAIIASGVVFVVLSGLYYHNIRKRDVSAATFHF